MNILAQIKKAKKTLFGYPVTTLEHTDYEAYWRSKRKSHDDWTPNSFQKARAMIIAENIADGESVLDVGCGDCVLLAEVMKQKRINGNAADITEYARERANTIGVSFVKHDMRDQTSINDLPLADHVLLCEVLEHIPAAEEYLMAMMRVARKSVFVSVPNTGYIMHRLRLLFGRFPLQWRLHPNEHVRFWTYSDMCWWLRALNMHKKSVVFTYEGIPVLNKIFKSFFSAGFVVQISVMHFEKND